MSEKMKREEKLQSQQLNGDFTVRTWISSLWSRSIINNLQGKLLVVFPIRIWSEVEEKGGTNSIHTDLMGR